MMKKTNWLAATAVALTLGAVCVPAQAFASTDAGASTNSSANQEDKVTRVEVDFAHKLSLTDALAAKKPAGDTPMAYRFDGDGVVGEWAPSQISSSEFLSEFKTKYGTEPEVVGYLVNQKLESVQESAKSGQLPQRLEKVKVSAPVFDAPAIPQAKVKQLSRTQTAAVTPSATTAAASSATSWYAGGGYFSIGPGGNYMYFTAQVTSPHFTNIPNGYGIEIGMDQINDDTGTRGGIPACGPDFRNRFVAENYNWASWQAYIPGGNVSASRPYADYNDLFDSCGRQSMAIGFQYANKVSGTEVDTTIQAPPGYAVSNRLFSNIQIVDNVNCTSTAGSGVGGLTDCMGTAQKTPPGLTVGETLLAEGKLNVQRLHTVCWSTALKNGVPSATTFPVDNCM